MHLANPAPQLLQKSLAGLCSELAAPQALSSRVLLHKPCYRAREEVGGEKVLETS